MSINVKEVLDKYLISDAEFETIKEKSKISGEFSDDTFDDWFEKRFVNNLVSLTKDEYALMCVNALRILPGVSASDYGSSRQRDMGQLWADMTRGYLGEMAFLKFLRTHWDIKSSLGHEKGNLADYLPMDIHEVSMPGETPRKPKINVSVKTTKWNGIWLDIPGDQFAHSDVHVLIKVGIGRDHLFAFFKEISVFQDKVLKVGEEVGSLSKGESQTLYDSLPSFKEVPAYICGFALKDAKYSALPYSGKKGRKNYTITGWNGPIAGGDLDEIKSVKGLAGRHPLRV
ncbi:MAG: hypothetical protein HY280_11090 [Nitrospinae bacterium]|nr:hypothetical protein [Nitrospinota bacterium]